MALDLDEYRQQSLETWEEITPGWEQRHDWLRESTAPVSDWLVRSADPQPGQTVLDIAAGPGDLDIAASELVGAQGRVISTDFAPEMVDLARRLGESRGLDNVKYLVLDAERMDLEDGSVDVALCKFGYMLMADPSAALRETRRVLRPGGPLACSVWSTPDRNPWAAVSGMTLVGLGHVPPPEPGMPGIFAMGEPGLIHELVTGAGFGEPELEKIGFAFEYHDFDDYWDSVMSLAGRMAVVIKELPRDEHEVARAAVMENLAPFRNGDGSYTCAAEAWGVRAR
jgi:SAM-dependent methyltransferase